MGGRAVGRRDGAGGAAAAGVLLGADEVMSVTSPLPDSGRVSPRNRRIASARVIDPQYGMHTAWYSPERWTE